MKLKIDGRVAHTSLDSSTTVRLYPNAVDTDGQELFLVHPSPLHLGRVSVLFVTV